MDKLIDIINFVSKENSVKVKIGDFVYAHDVNVKPALIYGSVNNLIMHNLEAEALAMKKWENVLSKVGQGTPELDAYQKERDEEFKQAYRVDCRQLGCAD